MTSFVAPPPERPIVPGQPPRFSVVIPAYEAAAFAAEAVGSALAQTLPPHEVIVCDDGSTDDLAGALARYAGRIVLLRKQNGGLASARNAGIRVSSGEFIAFLDADNVLLPKYLEALGELAAVRPDLDILTTDAYLELGGEIYGRYYRGKARFVATDQRRGIIHQHFIFGNGAIRRKALLAVGGYDETVVAEDTDLFVRMILQGSCAGLVDEPLCVYRIRRGSLSSSRPRMLRAATVVLERAREHPSLTPDELRYLRGELAAKRRLAALAEAEEALRGLAPHPRWRSLKVALGPPGYGIASRVKALAAAIAPRAAGRYLERLDRTAGESRLSLQTHGR
jgi:cellulose synthase/poly-beta-1,6-N-acetylglucosamine synthase-like glycosyltransferase